MEFEHPDISSIWLETNQVDSSRVILKAFGPGGISAQRVLAAFRQVYPGKHDTIEQALTLDWTKDKFAPACEMEPFPIGEMHKFWPQLMMPEGRIYFAGTYADNMSRGMESCIRSAQRVAKEIDKNLMVSISDIDFDLFISLFPASCKGCRRSNDSVNHRAYSKELKYIETI